MCQPTLICGFAGIGKTQAQRLTPIFGNLWYKQLLDLDSSLYSWCYEEGVRKERNPMFPFNYVEDIKKLMQQGRYAYIFISCHEDVRKLLQQNKVPYIIVAPMTDLQNEYMIRYMKRGSGEKFIKTMYSAWYDMHRSIANDSSAKIYLDSGQYLQDILPPFPRGYTEEEMRMIDNDYVEEYKNAR